MSFEFSDQIFNQCFSLYTRTGYSAKNCGNILLFKCIIVLSIFPVFQTFNNFISDIARIVIPRHDLFNVWYLFLEQIDVDTYFMSSVIKCPDPCSFCVPWFIAVPAWIRALYDRAHKICINVNLFWKQVPRIKKVMSWNGYPRYIRNKIIKRLENRKNNDTLEQQNIATIFCRIPCAGVQGKTLIKNLVRKLKRHIDKPFKLRNIYRTKKLSYYCNTKDEVPEYLKPLR